MGKTSKVILGILTTIPLVYVVLSPLYIISQFSGLYKLSQEYSLNQELFNSTSSFNPFSVFLPHALIMILMMGLLVFYLVNVFKNKKVQKDMKPVWAILLFIGNIFAMPVYFYLYIWKKG